MSTPCTLVEAFGLLRQRQQKPPNDQGSTGIVDILGIVSNISTSRTLSASTTSLSSGRCRFRQCQIWLLDESLDTTPKASNGALFSSRIVLYKSSEIARILKEKIEVGDILRFNRIAIKSFRESTQFQFSFQDPEPGLAWFRLGSIDNQGRFFKRGSNDIIEINTPKNMETSKERVAELVNWYKDKRKTNHPPSMPNSLPTRKRQLDEIQSSIGFLSNITVSVMHVRSEPAIEKNASYSSREMTRKNRTRPPVTFASFTDDSGAIMPFIDWSSRFLQKLKSAQNNRHNMMRLVMTNVLTEHQHNIQGLATSVKEIILVPTETTTGRLISEEENFNHFRAKKSGHCGFIETQTQGGRAYATDTIVLSSIADVWVNGLSLKSSRSILTSPSAFLKTIIGSDGSFNKAIIYLETNDEQVCNTGIFSTPDVLKILCGSLDAVELSNDDKLCLYSIEFLQHLLRGHIVLDWTLNKDKNNNLVIVKAALHRVHE